MGVVARMRRLSLIASAPGATEGARTYAASGPAFAAAADGRFGYTLLGVPAGERDFGGLGVPRRHDGDAAGPRSSAAGSRPRRPRGAAGGDTFGPYALCAAGPNVPPGLRPAGRSRTPKSRPAIERLGLALTRGKARPAIAPCVARAMMTDDTTKALPGTHGGAELGHRLEQVDHFRPSPRVGFSRELGDPASNRAPRKGFGNVDLFPSAP
jgi:hypothetical protein